MKIKSQHIDTIPLCFNDLKLLITSRAGFEKHTKCKLSGIELPVAYCEELAEMMERNSHIWNNKSNDYLFYTLWVMIERESKTIVGQFTFNGLPNSNGEVEVFFSIEPPYRRRGFATEVMESILNWAAKADLIKFILIEADLDNKAAMASLRKLGFKPLEIDDEVIEQQQVTKYFRKVPKTVSLKDEDLDFD